MASAASTQEVASESVSHEALQQAVDQIVKLEFETESAIKACQLLNQHIGKEFPYAVRVSKKIQVWCYKEDSDTIPSIYKLGCSGDRIQLMNFNENWLKVTGSWPGWIAKFDYNPNAPQNQRHPPNLKKLEKVVDKMIQELEHEAVEIKNISGHPRSKSRRLGHLIVKCKSFLSDRYQNYVYGDRRESILELTRDLMRRYQELSQNISCAIAHTKMERKKFVAAVRYRFALLSDLKETKPGERKVHQYRLNKRELLVLNRLKTVKGDVSDADISHEIRVVRQFYNRVLIDEYRRDSTVKKMMYDEPEDFETRQRRWLKQLANEYETYKTLRDMDLDMVQDKNGHLTEKWKLIVDLYELAHDVLLEPEHQTDIQFLEDKLNGDKKFQKFRYFDFIDQFCDAVVDATLPKDASIRRERDWEVRYQSRKFIRKFLTDRLVYEPVEKEREQISEHAQENRDLFFKVQAAILHRMDETSRNLIKRGSRLTPSEFFQRYKVLEKCFQDGRFELPEQ